MKLQQRITEDLKAAMKAGQKDRLRVLRLLKAKLQEAEVELRGKQGRDATLDEDAVMAVLAASAKQRRDSIDSYRQGQRDDLVAQEEAELAVLQTYLPQPLTPEEIRAVVLEVVAATGAGSLQDMGAVMKAAMPRFRGAADGKEVSRIVREVLGAAQSGS